MTTNELVISCEVFTRMTVNKESCCVPEEDSFLPLSVLLLGLETRPCTSRVPAAKLVRSSASTALLLVSGSRSHPVTNSNICSALKHPEKYLYRPIASRYIFNSSCQNCIINKVVEKSGKSLPLKYTENCCTLCENCHISCSNLKSN